MEIPPLFQVCPELNLQELYCLPFIRPTLFRKNLFPRNAPLFTGQAELSELSGVKLRSIQMYEQRVNSIDKAQAGTVYKLSRVLGCTVEDLLESPEM